MPFIAACGFLAFINRRDILIISSRPMACHTQRAAGTACAEGMMDYRYLDFHCLRSRMGAQEPVCQQHHRGARVPKHSGTAMSKR